MFRKAPYFLLLLALLLLQLFVFDKLLISLLIAPTVYITFILLLPMQSSQLTMLLWGGAIGLLFDLVTGMSGVNSIATIFVSYIRIWLLNITVGKDMIQLGVAPLPHTIGINKFLSYMSLVVLLHCAVLFTVEFLRLDQMEFLLRRILYSGAISALFVWLIAAQFENMLSRRR